MATQTAPAARTNMPARAKRTAFALAAVLIAAMAASPLVQAQAVPVEKTPPGTKVQGPRVKSTTKIEQARGARYDNRYEVYGGLSFMNGQAGQNIPVRANMGGGEGMFTYWMTPRLGVAADYRFEGGTTPTFPNPYYNRVKIFQQIIAGGVQYRGFQNRYAAVDYHALVGVAKGTFDGSIKDYPGGSPISATGIGLYPNKSTPWGAAGGSVDFNYSENLAIRLSPDIIFEHYGTETREYFSISLGVMYRFGRR